MAAYAFHGFDRVSHESELALLGGVMLYYSGGVWPGGQCGKQISAMSTEQHRPIFINGNSDLLVLFLALDARIQCGNRGENISEKRAGIWDDLNHVTASAEPH
jgi:hypothetical protein